MRVLITGGAGFIGSHLGDALLAKGHTVRALDNLDPQVHAGGERPSYLNPEIELQIGDVRDRDAVARAMDGIDTVVHFAAAVGVGQSMYAIERYTSINAMGAAIVLEEIAKRRDQLGRVLVASSMSIYGEGRYRCPLHGLVAPQVRSDEQLDRREWELVCDECGAALEPLPTDETKPIWPMSIYAVGKRDHEEMFLAIGRAHRLPTVAMRFFNVYGDRQALSNPYTGVAAIFGGRLLNDNAPLVFEDGLQSRDFIHVSDIATGCITALETGGADYRAVNLGTGVPTTVLDVARELARGLGKDIQPEIVNKFRAGDIRHCVSDIALARELIGFEPKMRFDAGMRELLGWVATQQATDTVDSAPKRLCSSRPRARACSFRTVRPTCFPWVTAIRCGLRGAFTSAWSAGPSSGASTRAGTCTRATYPAVMSRRTPSSGRGCPVRPRGSARTCTAGNRDSSTSLRRQRRWPGSCFVASSAAPSTRLSSTTLVGVDPDALAVLAKRRPKP